MSDARVLVTLALREMRRHPARFAATVLVSALAVALLAGTLTFAATESAAILGRTVLYASRADAVVDSHVWNSEVAVQQRDEGIALAETTLRSDPDVAAVERFSQLYVQLSHGERFSNVMLNASPANGSLRWYAPSEGRLPTVPDEIVLTRDSAAALGVGVGDAVTLGLAGWQTRLRVVGLTDEAGFSDPPAYVTLSTVLTAGSKLPPANRAAIINPRSTEHLTPGSSGGAVGLRLLVDVRDPARTQQVVARALAALDAEGFMRIVVEPKAVDRVRAEASDDLRSRTASLNNALATAGALAVAIGAVIVINTYSVLLAQRRQQIALLRLVGARRGQVVARFALEALLVVGTGALVGVPLGIAVSAAGSAWLTHSLGFGLVVPGGVLTGAVAGAAAVLLLAALAPIVAASGTRPLESFRGVTAEVRRPPSLRTVGLCALAAVPAVVLLVWFSPRLGGMGIPAAGLIGGVVYLLSVPAVLTGVVRGAFRRFGGPMARLARGNAVRNPRRTGATAVGVTLAVGLIAAVLVGVPAGRGSAFAGIDRQYPVELSLQAAGLPPDSADPNTGNGQPENRDADGNRPGFSADALDRVRRTPGVSDAVLLPTTEPVFLISGAGVADNLPIAALPASADPFLNRPLGLRDGQIGLPAARVAGLKSSVGSRIQVKPVIGNSLLLEVVETNVNDDLAVMTPATLARLKAPTNPGLILARVADADDADSVTQRLTGRLLVHNPGLTMSGSAQAKAALRRELDAATAMALGLLGLAALIAAVGVMTALTLSVVERTRELALLRTLGMQRRSVRRLVLTEALMVCGLAALLALPLGTMVGWLGALATTRALALTDPGLPVPWAGFGVLLALALAISALAALLPAVRAGRVPPLEALSDVG